MRRAILTTMILVLSGACLGAGGAAAATKGGEFGDTCQGTRPGAPYGAAFEVSRSNSTMPLAAPTSGVLTKWIAYLPALFPAEGVPPMTVRVVRVLGSGQAEVTAKAALEKLHAGRNEFTTRLPIQAGEYLAFGSNEGASIVCSQTAEEEELNVRVSGGGFALPLVQPGEKATFESTEARVPVSGVIEPDVDGDGFGNLTQDGCPQSADYHGSCPVLHFAPGFSVGADAVRVRVKSSADARVAVTGVLPGLGTSLGTRRTIAAGKFSTFSLAIPPALAAKLGRIDSSRTLPVRLVARVNHVVGNVSTDRLTVRLPGRG